MTLNPDDIRKEPLDPNVRYRVRDGKGTDETKPCVVWGEDLTWDEANKLKELVVGQEKSRTARLEPMGTAPPSLVTAATPPNTDPELADVMNRALAAARGPAMAAQARVDAALFGNPDVGSLVIPNMQAGQMLASPAAPIDLSAVMPDVAQIADIDLGDLGDGESADMPQDADDQAELDAQLAEYEAKGKAKFAIDHPGMDWDALTAENKAAICFEAANAT